VEQWLNRVKNSIFPFSIEKEDVQKALVEWHYTGDTFDLEASVEDCELCGHKEIRYQFTIRNQYTDSELLIGSECITRFDIPAISEGGASLSAQETKKLVSRDRRKLITDAKKRRLIKTLVELKKSEESFNIDSFINYYGERGAFTPKQLAMLFWRLSKYQIPRHPADFKLTIRRDREKEQLLDLQDFQLAAISECLSGTQMEFLRQHGRFI
jgi:hypothetical protein